MRKVTFLDLKPPSKLRSQLDEAYTRVMDSGRFIGGNEVIWFGAEFKGCLETGVDDISVITVANGFDGLQLSLRAMGITNPEDEVLVPHFTCLPVWMAVSAAGATPVPVTPNLKTYNITHDDLLDAVTENTKAAIIVHMFGRPVEEILQIRASLWIMGIKMIEDCSHAHGADINGKKLGTLGDAGVFSMYPTKNLGAYGDAGVVVISRDRGLASKVMMIKDYGDFAFRGINSRMDSLQAAFLRAKLAHLEEEIKQRRANARFYINKLRSFAGITLPKDHQGHVWHQFVIRHPNRRKFMDYMRENGVDTMIHYRPLPSSSRIYKDNYESNPVAEMLSDTVVSLPIGSHLTREDLEYVVDVIKNSPDFSGG